jgi:NAD(P)-dependent dehydrogenase (short-subunit alcohol dehydrogenase family)
MSERFKGKVAIVTGAGSGIGRATVFALAAEGASVVLADVDRAAGEDALTRAIAAGGKAIFVQADVSKETEASRTVDQAVATYGGLDILINNAGTAFSAPVAETSEADWDRILGANLKSAFLCSKAAIPQMEKRGGGVIVNVASVAGERAPRRSAVYSAAKAAVIALTRSIAVDYAGQNIRANCVRPGITDTPMLRRAAEAVSPGDAQAAYESWSKSLPEGRPGTPEEIASAVLYLASSEASFITGSVLDVDGGTMASLM